MENPLPQALVEELGIDPQSIVAAPFQGEICRVFNAHSTIHNRLVIKSAIINQEVNERGQTEIAQNIVGYSYIPEEFRPEVLATDQESTFMVMPNCGRPLRDLLWSSQYDIENSQAIIEGFLGNMGRLLSLTRTSNIDAGLAYLHRLKTSGTDYLQSDFGPITPRLLRGRFPLYVDLVMALNDGTAGLATRDFTQGNLLIDTTKSPQSLKIIDPKAPRLVNGQLTYAGVPEVDLGVFSTTAHLNAPDSVEALDLEGKLRMIGQTFRGNTEYSNLAFDLGKIYGSILIASFPSSIDKVKTYFNSVGATFNQQTAHKVERERVEHLDRALEVAKKLELTYL